jgi:hypothetical protein
MKRPANNGASPGEIPRGIGRAEPEGLPLLSPEAQEILAREMYGVDHERIARYLAASGILSDHATIAVKDDVTGIETPIQVQGEEARDRN